MYTTQISPMKFWTSEILKFNQLIETDWGSLGPRGVSRILKQNFSTQFQFLPNIQCSTVQCQCNVCVSVMVCGVMAHDATQKYS